MDFVARKLGLGAKNLVFEVRNLGLGENFGPKSLGFWSQGWIRS